MVAFVLVSALVTYTGMPGGADNPLGIMSIQGKVDARTFRVDVFPAPNGAVAAVVTGTLSFDEQQRLRKAIVRKPIRALNGAALVAAINQTIDDASFRVTSAEQLTPVTYSAVAGLGAYFPQSLAIMTWGD